MKVCNRPYMLVHIGPSIDSEVIDELIYGQKVDMIEEVDDTWVKIKTLYDYQGYVSKSELLELENDFDSDYIIDHLITDVMQEAKYDSQVIMTLTKGALVKSTDINEGKWEKIELLDGRIGYIRNGFAKKTVENCNIIKTAMEYLNVQYRWGGRSGLGIDCSGLVHISYEVNGYIVPRDASMQESFFKTIASDQVKPGDLYFFPGHVAIAMGNWEYIHANGIDGKVVINSLDPSSSLYRDDLAKTITSVGTLF